MGGKSFELHVPQRGVDVFLSELNALYENETNGVPAYANQLERQVPEIRVIDQSRADFEQKLAELRTNRKKYSHLMPKEYAAQIHKLNVWINPDRIYFADQEDVATFSKMAKYAQNLYLFDHEVPFEHLDPHLQRALGGETASRLIIQAKK